MTNDKFDDQMCLKDVQAKFDRHQRRYSPQGFPEEVNKDQREDKAIK